MDVHVHGVLAGDPAGPLNVVGLVLFEEELDAAREPRNDLVLFLLDLRPVDLDAALDLEPETLEVLGGVLVFVGDVEEGLRGDAAHVEAGSSQASTLFDADCLQAQLGSLDRGNVAYANPMLYLLAPLQSPPSRRPCQRSRR